MNAYGRWLRWILLAVGAVILTALGTAAMPHSWMDATHRRLGLGELPDIPIVGYLTRSASLLYAWHGAILVYISFDVARHLGLLRFLAALGLVFGAFMIILDGSVGMPLSWTLFEGPSIIVSSAAMGWLALRAGPAAEGGNSS